jgi:hypothetical protein
LVFINLHVYRKKSENRFWIERWLNFREWQLSRKCSFNLLLLLTK